MHAGHVLLVDELGWAVCRMSNVNSVFVYEIPRAFHCLMTLRAAGVPAGSVHAGLISGSGVVAVLKRDEPHLEGAGVIDGAEIDAVADAGEALRE
ncbi:hypothetical protein MFU01_49960 [Myxococcus fulvus]|uniref:Uncharacterized protein n=1 Tax=Myxococcus fulvus TaxID=33 RepID=A0A511T718_MYXFU|nr:hypothetical protein MFU01_49960 [Myxococcus fulvus]